ncbi:Mov34/MPN/PAD-1 family protein [Xanthomonas sp. AmX2]|uniref:Mov34/MPN/PAD-1 family protein n=1 Tax=Xanthomonas sp. TaxID=29446 RepID=UPI00197F2E70|nr:Mov34/MPN/PAD-1 family protein [Xanthomonas sp.]MBN6150166.1 Mov34/MPN/PAD-1 family protein [Xanthomonas sp.]
MYRATFAEYAERVVIAQEVLDHTARFRQLNWSAREAGGQLFGSIVDGEVVIATASGPYAGDTRRRYTYRSNSDAAQRCIDEHARLGFLYLGEWHTHPETAPSASTTDLYAMGLLRAASLTRVNTLLLMIQGTAQGVEGVVLYSFADDCVARWRVARDVDEKSGISADTPAASPAQRR